MTSSLDTEYFLAVSTSWDIDFHRLVPAIGWRPDLIDIADPDLVGFADDLTGIVVRVDMVSVDGTTAGFLIPKPARCALCDNQRHITLHRWSDDQNPAQDDASTLAVYEPELDCYSIYDRKPCPACRYVEYELSRNDSATDAEDPS